MAMVSLLIAPLLDGNDDWENWYVGACISVAGVVVTGALLWTGILSWKDPLSGSADEPKQKAPEAARPETPKQAWGKVTVPGPEVK